MPSVSKVQQRAAGVALAVKKGEMPMSTLKGASKEMLRTMKASDLKHLAETPRKGLPARQK